MCSIFLLDFDMQKLMSSGHGGGWGYSGHSVESIRFMCDTDILLGGFGLFGGRGEYFGRIKVRVTDLSVSQLCLRSASSLKGCVLADVYSSWMFGPSLCL